MKQMNLGREMEKCRGKKKKQTEIICQTFQDLREGEGASCEEKSENKGRPKLCEHPFSSVSKLVLSGPTATKSKAIPINKKMILYFKCSYCHESSK